MKNSIYIAYFLMIMGISSCSKEYLDEKLYSSYNPTELNDEAGLNAALVGLQQQYSTWHTFLASNNGLGNGQGWLGCWQIGTDVAYNKAPADLDPWCVPFTEYGKLTATDPAVLYAWKWAYKIINNSNSIITSLQNPKTVLARPVKTQMEAEARFYRGLAYNTLVTLFGKVPLITSPVNGPKTDFVRASLTDLNKLIEDDLVFAKNNLPSVKSITKDSKRKAHSAMASQELAEAYLRMDKNAEAEAACDAIINSGDFSLITQRYGIKANQPGDPFSDMFIYGNQRRAQGNKEAIWVLEIENPSLVVGGTGSSLPAGASDEIGYPQQRRVWGSRYFQQKGMLLCDSLGGRGISRIALTNWVLKRLYTTPNDMRNSKYNLRRNYVYNDPKFPDLFGKKVDTTDSSVNTERFIVPQTNKWNQYDPNDPFGAAMIKDIIIMRLGETYLLKAEAQFKQGNNPGAAQTINILRDRAGTARVTAADINMDFILDERARELLAEENRRMTLMRTGQLVNRVVGRGQKIKGLTSTHLLLPIPQTEIDLNKDAVLEQNPGY